MRSMVGAALLGVFGLAGCGYFPVPPDPIRILTSPAEVSACHRLGAVGIARTDGTAPFDFGQITVAIRAHLVGSGEYGPPVAYGSVEVPGQNFAVRVNYMRDAALALGATDLLLARRFYRDWSWVEGIAYRCRR